MIPCMTVLTSGIQLIVCITIWYPSPHGLGCQAAPRSWYWTPCLWSVLLTRFQPPWVDLSYHGSLGSPDSLPSSEVIQHVSCHGCVHLREITTQIIINGCIINKDILAGLMAICCYFTYNLLWDLWLYVAIITIVLCTYVHCTSHFWAWSWS